MHKFPEDADDRRQVMEELKRRKAIKEITWEDVPAELKERLELDVMIYGNCYLTVDEKGKFKRIGPTDITIRVNGK